MTKRFLLATTAAAAMAASAAAHAQQVNGGGSTLASPSYVKEFGLYQNVNSDADFTDTYTPEGSGAAQASVITNVPAGFDFGASDATISQTQLDQWNGNVSGTTGRTRNATAGYLVELPMIGTPITVPVNLPTVSSNTSLNLSDAQLCGIFSGKFTTWSAAGVSGLSGASNNITVGYRGDNSGTSFLFTQHLSKVCTAGSNSNITFFATQNFASLFNGTVPSNFKSTLYVSGSSSGGTTSTGSPSVQYLVAKTSGAVGYLSPDFTAIAAAPNLATGVTAAPYVAEVNGVQPTVANTGYALAAGVPVSLTGAAANTPTDPNSFIPVNAQPSTTNPSQPQYPIVGYTTWLLPQCFSDPTVAATLRNFLSAHYNNTSYRQIYNASGFSNVPTGLFTTINRTYLTTSSAYAIGSNGATSSCSGFAGR